MGSGGSPTTGGSRLVLKWCVVVSLSFLLFCTPTAKAQSWKSCNGTVGECGGDDSEWLVDSHAARRILQGNPKHIVPGVFIPNKQVFPAPPKKPYHNPGCNGLHLCNTGKLPKNK